MKWLRFIAINACVVGFLSSFAIAQSPNLRCIALDQSGGALISWIVPTDSCGFFNKYYIFYSTNQAGPFTVIDSISSFVTTTYYHSTAGANLGSVYYYVQSNSGCIVNISDTLASIQLSVTSSLGLANLVWNPTHTPELSTATGNYIINREDTITGSLIVQDSVFQAYTYADTFMTCSDTISYQVHIVDSTGCISASSIAALNPDFQQPASISIDTVSVDTLTGLATISWTASSSFDVVGYIIYIANNFGGWDSIDVVLGKNNTFYMDLNSNVDTSSGMYNVAAYDGCGNNSVFGNGHNTMYLSGVLDTCAGEVTLSWNEYVNWPSGIDQYDIFMNSSGGTYQNVGYTTSNQFVYGGLKKDTVYCFIVRATGVTIPKSSSSNKICSYIDTVQTAGTPFQLSAEAQDSIKNTLYWNEDPYWAGLVSSYSIYRSTDGGTYQLIRNELFGTTIYVDSLEPLSAFRYGMGEFCYFVVPDKSSGNRYGCIDTSNVECVSQFPKYVVPNTFTPNGDGLNDIFLPIRVFIDKQNYLFIIYNRWGQKLFETTDPEEGWTGYLKDFVLPNDAYVYYVTFLIKGEIPIEKAGTVILMR